MVPAFLVVSAPATQDMLEEDVNLSKGMHIARAIARRAAEHTGMGPASVFSSPVPDANRTAAATACVAVHK